MESAEDIKNVHYLHPDFDGQTEKTRPSPLALLAETCKNICTTKDVNNNTNNSTPTITSSSTGVQSIITTTNSPTATNTQSIVVVDNNNDSTDNKRKSPNDRLHHIPHKRQYTQTTPSPSSQINEDNAIHTMSYTNNRRGRKSSSQDYHHHHHAQHSKSNNSNNASTNNNNQQLSLSILQCLTELFKQANPDLEKLDSTQLLNRLSQQLMVNNNPANHSNSTNSNNNSNNSTKNNKCFDVSSGYHLENDLKYDKDKQHHSNSNNNFIAHNSNIQNGGSSIKFCMYCGKFMPYLPSLLTHIHNDHQVNSRTSPQTTSNNPLLISELIKSIYPSPHHYLDPQLIVNSSSPTAGSPPIGLTNNNFPLFNSHSNITSLLKEYFHEFNPNILC